MFELEHLRHDWSLWLFNLQQCRGLIRQRHRVCADGFTFAPATTRQLPAVEELYRQLFGRPLLGWLHWVYRFRAAALISVLQNSDGAVIGFDAFMFNRAEEGAGIIHELYLGIAPAYQGQGLAVKLRRYSLDTYNHGSLKAVSTLAALNDLKALRTAQHAGFYIAKRSAKPPAHYLIYNLSPQPGRA